MPTGDDILQFDCPKCGKRLKAGRKIAGRRVKCPGCEQPVRVPGAQPTKPAATDNWLELDAPAISDLDDRDKQAKQIQAKKEATRKQKTEHNKERSAKAKVPPVPVEVRPKADDRGGPTGLDSPIDEFSLAPLEPTPQPKARSEQPKDSVPKNDGAKTKSAQPKKAPAESADSTPSVFDEDLPALADLEEPKKKPAGLDGLLSAQLSEDLLDDLGGEFDDADVDTPPVAEETEETNPEYRVKCPTCTTPQYVRLTQKGSKLKCPDCFDVFVIPPPNPSQLKQKKRKPDYETGPDLALSPQDHNIHTGEKRERSQAAKILEKAKSDVSEDELDGLYGGDFDTKGFVQRTFGCFRDPIAVAQILGYGLVFAGLFAVVQYAALTFESDFGKGMLLIAGILVPLVCMLFSLPMLAGGLSLIESVANNEPRLSHWPGFDLFDNIGDVLVVLFALAGALLPGAVVGSFAGSTLALGGHVQITCIMLTTFALFPILLLSMMDNGSLFAPISSAVVRSLKEATEEWGGYFLKTMFGFGITTLLWYLLIGRSVILAAIAGFLLPTLFFYVCQQIGALADGIAEHLGFEFAPSGADEADEE
ncbi:MAG: hypothetical protein Aurels2KO_51450 [Aureliella sp.]